MFLICLYTLTLQAEYDSTYVLACKQKFAIPEDVDNGDYIGYWKKTYSWLGTGTISYSIEQNFNDAFSINSSTGLITIADASQINGKIVQQDTVINLIIRTTESIYGYELDTAEIWIKENSYCRFFNYDYVGTQTGTRAQPFDRIGDVTKTAGYGYFFIRGVTYPNFYTGLITAIYGSETNPTLWGAYGTGTKPRCDGQGSTYHFMRESVSGVPADSSAYMYFYDFNISNYASMAVQISEPSKYMGFYNCEFFDNDQNSAQSAIAINTASYTDNHKIRPFEFINCVMDTVARLVLQDEDSFIKTGASHTFITNCKFGPYSRYSTIRFADGWGGHVKHCWMSSLLSPTTPRGNIFIRSDSLLIENNIIIGGGYGIQGIAPSGQFYFVPDNLIVRNNLFYGQGLAGIRIDPPTSEYDGSDFNVYEDNMILKTGAATYGFNLEDTKNDTIRRNIISGFDIGIRIFENTSDSSTNFFMNHNILYGNTVALDFVSAGLNYWIYNNVFDDPIDVADATGTTIFQNNYFTSITGSPNAFTNNIDIDTITTADHFVNYAGNDYNLLATAVSAIDMGTNVGITSDYKGYMITGTPDIGAYEYQSNSQAVTPSDPERLYVNIMSCGENALHWRDKSDNEDGFSIERKAGTGSFTQIAQVGSNIGSYTDYTTSADIHYIYRVRAHNTAGNSAYTNEADAYCEEGNSPPYVQWPQFFSPPPPLDNMIKQSVTVSDDDGVDDRYGSFDIIYWYIADDDQGTNMTSINPYPSHTVLFSSDQYLGKYIFYECIPVAGQGTSPGHLVTSSYFGPVTTDDIGYALTVTRNDTMGSITTTPGYWDGNYGWDIYDPGTLVTISANANAGYKFVRWEGDATGTENPLLFTMNSNTVINAIFNEVISEQTEILSPIADSYVQGGSAASDNNGTSTSIIVKTSPTPEYDRTGYLKFDLSGITSSISNATLRLNVGSTSAVNHVVKFVSDDSWTENSITYNNRPAASSVLDTSAVPASGEWIEFDITALTETERMNDGIMSVALMGLVETWVTYRSKEYSDPALHPQLVVSYGEIVPPATSDMLAHWPFEEGNGSTTEDISINTFDGSLLNGTLFSSDRKIGDYSIQFDGTNDYVDVGAIDLGAEFTLSFWVKIPIGVSSLRTLIANTGGGEYKDGFKLFVNTYGTTDRKLILETANGSVYDNAGTSTGIFTYGQWNHIAATVSRTSGSCDIYYNGIDATVDGSIRNDFATANILNLGRMTNSVAYLNGYLDDVRIYDHQLNATEIGEIYNLLKNASITDNTFKEDRDAQEQKLVIYPNPFTSDFTIHLGEIGIVARIDVVNTLGQVVESFVPENAEDKTISLSISEPAGIYMVRVHTNEQVIVRTVIKN